MRKTVHFCLASHDEVLFRSEDDYNYAFNCLALASLQTESRLLGESFMSDHYHACIQTDSLYELIKQTRYAYTRRFNAKYHRLGRLGEMGAFSLELDGIRHITTALSYVFRQGLHHGFCTTAYEYQHSSINCIFRKELGKEKDYALISSWLRYKYLPDGVKLPDGYRMSSSGLILREDIVDSKYVEELFITPKAFQYYMTRMSDNSWIREQKEEDPNRKPITLGLIEKATKLNQEELIRNEFGKVNRSMMTDTKLCQLIDQKIVPEYKADSIYEISVNKRKEIADNLLKRYNLRFSNGEHEFVTDQQLVRCLALKKE